MSPDPNATSPAPPVESNEDSRASAKSVWRFLPVLYFMQAIPVAMVQELTPVFYKDLGVDQVQITTWTSLISLPWGLQMFLGPLVDLSAAKRSWIVTTQWLLLLGSLIGPFMLGLPFALSLMIYGLVAVTSALCNVASDGFYLMAIPNKDTQAAFAGIQTTCYRLGRLFTIGLVPLLAGLIMDYPSFTVSAKEGRTIAVVNGNSVEYVRSAEVKVMQGNLVLVREPSKKLVSSIEPSGGASPVTLASDNDAFEVRANGEIHGGSMTGQLAKKERIGVFTTNLNQASSDPAASSQVAVGGEGIEPLQVKRKGSRAFGWLAGLLALGVIYGAGFLWNRRALPAPADDIAPENTREALLANLKRTGAILSLYATGYFSISAVWKLIANALSTPLNLPGWSLPNAGKFFNIDFKLSGVTGEVVQLILCLPLAIFALAYARRSLRGTEMGDALSSYFRQPKVGAIIAFMLLYRFGEAMVAKLSPLFLKDDLAKGGLALSNEQFGLIKGTIGVIGIILGGIVGGAVVSKVGLRKAFLPIAVAMHLPILLYWWAAVAQPSSLPVISFVEFIDQFGYGFGYAGYIIYIMQVAQRGSYRTAHYAIGTGLGATFIALAGITSGVLQASFGWATFFLAAFFLALPGLLTLLFIPLDCEPKPAEA